MYQLVNKLKGHTHFRPQNSIECINMHHSKQIPSFCTLYSPLGPFPPSVPIWHRLAKLSILMLEGIIKKISYERRDYELVDEKSLS